MHIGIFKFNLIGDVLLLTPVLRTLRKHFPDARITVVVNDYTAIMLHGNPDLDQLIVYPRAHIKSQPKWLQLRSEARLAMQIRRLGLDMAFNFTNGDRGLIYAWLSRASIRAGFIKKQWKSWSWKRKVLTHGVVPDPSDHQVIRQLKILGEVGIPFDPNERMHLEVSPEATDWAAGYGRDTGSTAPMVVVHPVARWLYKCWEPEKFARIIDWLQERMQADVLVTCGTGSEEKAYMEKVLTGCRTRPKKSFPGNITLAQLAALIEKSDLFVGIDTAPMHMAAALERPVVALFGPTSQCWIPWCHSSAVVRGPCICPGKSRRYCRELPCCQCMSAITVEQVQQEIARILVPRFT